MTAVYLQLPPPGPWIAQGPCRNDPNLFDPIEDGRSAGERDRVERAQQICLRDCPVRSECLAYALETRQQGTWGGEYFAQVHDRGVKPAPRKEIAA